MITASQISKTYPDGTKALLPFDMQINQGEFVAIIGRSGAGKTTFMKLINRMIPLTSGQLTVLGKDVGNLNDTELRKLRRQIGVIFQQFNLVKSLNVSKNIMMGRLGYHSDFAGALGLYNEEDKRLADHYLKKVGLSEKGGSLISQLSGGQQQRVAIARALVQDPQIILADEPMASLDPRLSTVVLDLLKYFNKTKNITVMVNIHVLELAKKYADRVLGFNQGRLIYDGTVADLTEDNLQKIYD